MPVQAPTTPDGEPVAGYLRRAAAYIIDGFVTFPLSLLAGLPFLLPLFDAYVDEFRSINDTVEVGGYSQDPFGFEFMMDNLWNMIGLQLVTLLVWLVYEIGFLRWKQATPGKLLLGVRVRPRAAPVRLTWGGAALRAVVKGMGGILALIPFVGSYLALAVLINFLWPLWDKNGQALHDKAARTNVVRTQPATAPAPM